MIFLFRIEFDYEYAFQRATLVVHHPMVPIKHALICVQAGVIKVL